MCRRKPELQSVHLSSVHYLQFEKVTLQEMHVLRVSFLWNVVGHWVRQPVDCKYPWRQLRHDVAERHYLHGYLHYWHVHSLEVEFMS
jgi:hypothetical protein